MVTATDADSSGVVDAADTATPSIGIISVIAALIIVPPAALTVRLGIAYAIEADESGMVLDAATDALRLGRVADILAVVEPGADTVALALTAIAGIVNAADAPVIVSPLALTVSPGMDTDALAVVIVSADADAPIIGNAYATDADALGAVDVADDDTVRIGRL